MNRSKRRSSKPARKAAKSAAKPPEPAPERGLKIGEAARAVGVEAYVLRFWETQFPILKPKHARSKHRFYQPRDLETLALIKRLLHQEGFTIAGANKYIRENGIDPSQISRQAAGNNSRAGVAPANIHVRQTLSEVRRDLESIRKLLKD